MNAPHGGDAALPLPVSTTELLPGVDPVEVIDVVCGVATHPAGDPAAAVSARRQALRDAVEAARAIGAEAVVGVRYDSVCQTNGQVQVAAYGTAVTVEAVEDLSDEELEAIVAELERIDHGDARRP